MVLSTYMFINKMKVFIIGVRGLNVTRGLIGVRGSGDARTKITAGQRGRAKKISPGPNVVNL